MTMDSLLNWMTALAWRLGLGTLFLGFCISALAQPADGWELVLQDDFDRAALGLDWHGTGFWRIEDGVLVGGRHADPGKNLLFCAEAFPQAVRLEYDASTSSPTPCDLSALVSADDGGVSSGIFFGFGSMHNSKTRLMVKGAEVAGAPLTIEAGRTYRVVLQRDGRQVSCWVDGESILSHTLEHPLNGPEHDRVGFYIWDQGRIDNVRVFTKDEPIHEQDDAPKSLEIAATAYPKPGKAVISVELPGKTVVREDTLLRVSLRRPWRWRDFAYQEMEVTPDSREEIVFDAHAWEPQTLKVKAELLNAHGDTLAEPAEGTLEWPGRDKAFRGIKVLNNFVWELLRVANHPPADGKLSYSFYLPVDRWVLVRSSAIAPVGSDVKLGFDQDDRAVVVHGATPGSTQEGMRYLPAGSHTLWVEQGPDARFLGCLVRAVPAIQHSRYPSRTQGFDEGYPYDWDFVERYLLDQVNTIITGGVSAEDAERLSKWKAETGGKLIAYSGRPGLHGQADLEKTPEALLNYIVAKLQGYKHADSLDGLLMDEFYKPDDPALPVYTQMVRLLQDKAEFSRVGFFPYAAGSFGKDDASAAFIEACLAGGGSVCWEGYVPEYASRQEAFDALRRYPARHLLPMEERVPGVTHQTVWVLGTFSFPWPFADGYPDVDFNAWIDLQFQFLATHPAYFGLGGVHLWRTGYMHEESVRVAAACFRHYCLEGETDRLLERPYLLTHIGNPDFTDGFSGWTTAPADADSLQALSYRGFGKLQGRYYQGNDTFAVFKRSSAAPNSISQTIEGLVPGRLYSLKMLSADFDELEAQSSERAVHGIAATVTGAEVLSGPRDRYQEPFPTRARMLGFSRKEPLWQNLHWQVFRATGATASLEISDWKDGKPAGPAGQRLLLNFIEVKPYTPR